MPAQGALINLQEASLVGCPLAGAALSGIQAQLLDLQQALQLGLAQRDLALQAQATKHQQAVGEAQESMHSRMTDAHAELQQQQRQLAESVADLGVSTFGNACHHGCCCCVQYSACKRTVFTT